METPEKPYQTPQSMADRLDDKKGHLPGKETDDIIDSEINTRNADSANRESLTHQENPGTDPNGVTEKPGFNRNPQNDNR